MKHSPGLSFAAKATLILYVSMLVAENTYAQKTDDAVTAKELLKQTDDLYRGQSSQSTIEMNIKNRRWERSLVMKVWSKGTDRSLLKILKPKKEKGVTTLMVKKNVWNYLPKVDRVMKVPSSMMSGSWMGSHFSNDDLVKNSRFEKDYTFVITQRPQDTQRPENTEGPKDGTGSYIIECTPKPNAPVVWGKVVVEIDGKTRIPLSQRFFDEKGELIRTLTYSNIQTIDGRHIPLHMRLEPNKKKGEYTEIIQRELKFDIDIPDSAFSMQSLRR